MEQKNKKNWQRPGIISKLPLKQTLAKRNTAGGDKNNRAS